MNEPKSIMSLAALPESVKIIESETFDQARDRANEEAANSSGSIHSVVMFRQGLRIAFAGAIPVRHLTKHVSTLNSSKKGDSPDMVARNKNRPVMPDHVAAISAYLVENAGLPTPSNPRKGRYILPPLTWNVKDYIQVYTAKTGSTIKNAYLVLPSTIALESTDGQHRGLGANDALGKMTEADNEFFGQDGIPFMIVCESDVRQIHQDFADAAKTRAIPPSMLTVYDLRQPINRLVIELIERCPVFKDKIDSTSSKLGKNSLCLFLANQVRQFCRAALVGDIAMAEVVFLEKASNLLPDEVAYQAVLDKLVSFVNLVAEHMPEWKQAATIVRGPGLNQVKSLRAKQTVAWTATGLNILGRLCYDFFNDAELRDNWRDHATRVALLSFDKSNPLWKDIMTLKKNKAGNDVWQIATQRGPVERAVSSVRFAIGLDQMESDAADKQAAA
jgi:DNA sulfur modification protein DndB